MTNFLKRFAQDESGAVTVDYVVLAAAVVGLGLAVSSVLFDNVRTLAASLNEELGKTTVVDVTLEE